VTKGDATGVYLVDEDSHVSLVDFKPGLSNSEVIEVPQGLEPGQTIVVFGQNSLEDGQLVNIITSK